MPTRSNVFPGRSSVPCLAALTARPRPRARARRRRPRDHHRQGRCATPPRPSWRRSTPDQKTTATFPFTNDGARELVLHAGAAQGPRLLRDDRRAARRRGEAAQDRPQRQGLRQGRRHPQPRVGALRERRRRRQEARLGRQAAPLPRSLPDFTIFGTPSATEPWGWRFEGHHISQNWTVVSGTAIAVEPAVLRHQPGRSAHRPEDRHARPRRRGGSRPHAADVARREAAQGGDGQRRGAEGPAQTNQHKADRLPDTGVAYTALTSGQQQALGS